MTHSDNDSFRDMQMAFIGKLMAGLSHEFKNHLAIIRELNGLTHDLLLLEKSGQPAEAERLIKNIAGIEERIGQAAEMCRFLSSFSHRMDQPLASFNVTEVLRELIYLLHRFARQHQVELVTSFGEELTPIYNNPALLQFTVFCIVGPALESLAKNSRIEITAAQMGVGIQILMSLEGEMQGPEAPTPWQQALPGALQMLAAQHSRSKEDDGIEQVSLTVSSIAESHNEKQ